MGIVPIFADVDVPKGLFAICLNPYETPIINEYHSFMEWVFDRHSIRTFFKEREHLLKNNPYYPNTVNEAAKRTFEEVSLLKQNLEFAKNNSIEDLCNFLQENFKALDNQSSFEEELQPSKTQGPDKDCWIRIYGVRVNPEMFIVTGGAIKLVHRIKDDKNLIDERSKLLRVRDYLKQEGLFDAEAYQEIILDI
jgi:hypothetical protein